jgi:hypothetical protein
MASSGQFSIAHAPAPPKDASAAISPDASIILTEDNLAMMNKSKSALFLDKTNLTISAPDSITLICGSAGISLSKDGTVTITGSSKVVLTGGSASNVTLDASAAAITASTIKLNS